MRGRRGPRYPLKGRKSLPLASGFGVGLARVAPHGSTRPDELVQGSDPRLWGGEYRFSPGGIGGGGGSFPTAHNSLTGKQGGKAPDEFYHAPKLSAGAIPFADANGVLTEDAAKLSWNAETNVLTAGGQVTVGNPGIGEVLLRFESERPWEFRQAGGGAGAGLQLICVSVNKYLMFDTDGMVRFRSYGGTTRVAIDSAGLHLGTLRAYFGAADEVSIRHDAGAGYLKIE